MVALQLLSNFIPPLSLSDKAKIALDRMAEFCVNHLPVVKEGEFIGLVSDWNINELSDFETVLQEAHISLIHQSVEENRHIYDVIKIVKENNLSVIPVTNRHNRYLGIISQQTLINSFAQIASIDSPGGIIVIELGARDFFLSEIARIIENNDTVILSSFIRSFENSTKLELTLKLNKIDLAPITASLERFNYIVKAAYNSKDGREDRMDNYDLFMRYLNT